MRHTHIGTGLRTCIHVYMIHLHVWLVTCVVGYMCGWLHVWSATCVVGYMCMWSATCGVGYYGTNHTELCDIRVYPFSENMHRMDMGTDKGRDVPIHLLTLYSNQHLKVLFQN